MRSHWIEFKKIASYTKTKEARACEYKHNRERQRGREVSEQKERKERGGRPKWAYLRESARKKRALECMCVCVCVCVCVA